MIEKLELYYPIKPNILTQDFGVNGEWYKAHGIMIIGHNGLDFSAKLGQEICAAHDGLVIFSGLDANNGEYIEIITNEEKNIDGVIAFAKTIYCHMQTGGRKVAVGDKVKTGQVIGLAGTTGLSTGVHLHFGLKRDAKGKGPLDYLTIDWYNGYFGALNPTRYFCGFYAEDAEQVTTTFQKIISLLTNWRDSLLAQKK